MRDANACCAVSVCDFVWQLCLAGRTQLVGEGAHVEIGDDGYRAAVASELQLYAYRPGSNRIERKADLRVACFDGWLALKTNGAVRFVLPETLKHLGGGALEQAIAEGNDAVAPIIQAGYGWAFYGWDRSLDNISGDLVIKAVASVSNTILGNGDFSIGIKEPATACQFSTNSPAPSAEVSTRKTELESVGLVPASYSAPEL